MARGLQEGRVGLRPPRLRDATTWSWLRLRNEAWLAPWEPSSSEPWAVRHSVAAWPSALGSLRRLARAGVLLPFMITYDDELVGQLTVNNVVRGALRSRRSATGWTRAIANRGITTTAVAMATDHCFGPVGLHRVEVDIRPENVAQPPGRREARLPRRGPLRALPGHRRRLAGPRLVRVDRRGRPERAAPTASRTVRLTARPAPADPTRTVNQTSTLPRASRTGGLALASVITIVNRVTGGAR